jgi:hypothetical protein
MNSKIIYLNAFKGFTFNRRFRMLNHSSYTKGSYEGSTLYKAKKTFFFRDNEKVSLFKQAINGGHLE